MTPISDESRIIFNNRCLLIAGLTMAVGLALTQFSFGRDDYWGLGTHSSGGSIGNEWYIEETRRFEKGILRLPDNNRLSDLEIQWSEVIVEDLGNFCTISGCIRTKNEAGQLEPIDWQQYIAVHLNKEPRSTPDWSGVVDSESVSSEQAKVNRDGTFRATFDLRKCNEKFGSIREVQAGISLAQQKSSDFEILSIQIKSTFPVLEQSITMLNVPLNKELPEIIRLINRATHWPDSNTSAVDLIRVSNALRKLNRDEAIQAMEDYRQLILAHDSAFDIFESYILYGIIQCAFEPADPNVRLPSPKYLRSLDGWRRSIPIEPWPRDPMEIHEDIPWLLGRDVALGGLPFDPLRDLVWLRRHGVLRDSPMRPADNPLESAERLMKEPRFAMLSEDTRATATSQLKEQAWAMVADLLPPIRKNTWGNTDVEGNWKKLLKASKTIGLYWDESTQTYSIPAQGVSSKPLR